MFSKDCFSDRLKSLRKGKGIKQSELASIIGKKNTAISMMESGERGPSVEVLCVLCQFFDVSADYLLGLSDNPNSHKG